MGKFIIYIWPILWCQSIALSSRGAAFGAIFRCRARSMFRITYWRRYWVCNVRILGWWGNWTHMKLTQKQRETCKLHTGRTVQESNPGLSCCEAWVLTNQAPRHFKRPSQNVILAWQVCAQYWQHCVQFASFLVGELTQMKKLKFWLPGLTLSHFMGPQSWSDLGWPRNFYRHTNRGWSLLVTKN